MGKVGLSAIFLQSPSIFTLGKSAPPGVWPMEGGK